MADGPVSTCEGAAARRAAHARFERPPVFDDTWAFRLLEPRTQWSLRLPFLYRRRLAAKRRDGTDDIVAFALAAFRRTDELVEEACAAGIDQYVVLSAGFDSFALRRGDLPVTVFEVDHPEPQAVKRARVERATRTWPAHLVLVPVDFETTSIDEALRASSFDVRRPAVASWLNSINYLTKDATAATFAALGRVLAPRSRLVFNYPARVALTDAQKAALAKLRATVAKAGEPFRATYEEDEMLGMIDRAGFTVDEHLTEADVATRWFAGRTDGPRPTLPGRMVVATRRPHVTGPQA